jgi:hypothetical protein
LARALKSRKTLKGVPSTINCRYKKIDFLLSGTLHFGRFLKFKSSSSCCGRNLFLEIWIFRPCLRKITLQIQEDPQRGSLPLYIADTRDANPKRRMVDPWKELLLQKNQHQR